MSVDGGPDSMAAPESENELVSVVIVNYNGRQLLSDCLKSVFAQPYRPIEVIVVDNASTDGSVEMVRRDFTRVRVVANNVNRGFAGGNNDGCAVATGEYVALLNNDTIVGDSWLTGLLHHARRGEVGAVASFVVTEGIPDEFYKMNGTLNYLGYNIMRHFADVSRIFYAGGTSMMFRKSVSAKPFPDEYFLYHEDVYFSWKLRLQGLSVVMAQESRVKHLGSVTTKRTASSIVTFFQERNRVLNALLFFETRSLVLLAPLFIAEAIAKTALALIASGKSLTGIVKAYWWLITHMRWIRRERAQVQKGRTVRDSEILRLMSAEVIDPSRWNHPIGRIINRLGQGYADVVGMPYHVADATDAGR